MDERTRTTDMHGFTGENCRHCGTTFADCTARIFGTGVDEGHACCAVCRNTSTHNSDEFTKKKDETVKVTVTLSAEQAAKFERAVKIMQAYGEADATIESLVVSGSVNFVDGFLTHFDDVINIHLKSNAHN
jgi:hypothetical protein